MARFNTRRNLHHFFLLELTNLSVCQVNFLLNWLAPAMHSTFNDSRFKMSTHSYLYDRTLVPMIRLILTFSCLTLFAPCVSAQNETVQKLSRSVAPLTEPPCSYCVDQHLKSLIKPNDPVLAWIRGAHNGGAFPLRHFISKYRVINDTYGLFFYDPDGGYISAFKKDYGYEYHGRRNGVMIVKSADGTLWSALSGKAISGPQQGKKLQRVPSFSTTWSHWLLLHPESTAYNLFDGKRYPVVELPAEFSEEARTSLKNWDSRLGKLEPVIGIEGSKSRLAVSLKDLPARQVINVSVDAKPVSVFWYQKTQTAVAFHSILEGRKLTFYADEISPETAPFKDKETGTRWTLAGRGVDGPLKGKELDWVDSVQCRWYAWSTDYPESKIHKTDN